MFTKEKLEKWIYDLYYCIGVLTVEKEMTNISSDIDNRIQGLIELSDKLEQIHTSITSDGSIQGVREMLIAKCKKNIDPWGDIQTDLVVGVSYEVKKIDMGQSYTSIKLVGNPSSYNSVLFDFFENRKKIDIYRDKRFNPYWEYIK